MYKKPFIRELAKRSGTTQAISHNVLVDYYTLMLEEFEKMEVGDKLHVRGFGCFEKKQRPSHRSKSVNTGEWIMTQPKPYITFELSENARLRMNAEPEITE